MDRTGTSRGEDTHALVSSPRLARDSRNQLIIFIVMILAVLCIYFTTFTSGVVQRRSHESSGLNHYGLTPYPCSSSSSSVKSSSSSSSVVDVDVASASQSNSISDSKSILMSPRYYFSLTSSGSSGSGGSSAVAKASPPTQTYLRSHTIRTHTDTNCHADCHNFKSDAGHCLLSSDISVSKSTSTYSGSSSGLYSGTSIRCLPSFLIIGAMKAGTGALLKALLQHPLLRAGKGSHGENEVHFFGSASASASEGASEGTTCPWVQYAKHFPNSKTALTFDKSPDILRLPVAHAQMAHMLPSVKLIVLLRDPTTRAISAFDHHCRHGRYVRLLSDMTLFGASVSDTSERDTKAFFFAKNSIVRLDWLVDAAFNVKSPRGSSNSDSDSDSDSNESKNKSNNKNKSKTKNKVFGSSHSFTPLSHKGCLLIKNMYYKNINRDIWLKKKRNDVDGDCKPMSLSFTTLQKYYTTLSYPCSASDVIEYYFGLDGVDSAGTGVGTGTDTSVGTSSRGNIHSISEISHGIYLWQLQSLYSMYPATQIHIEFQEKMYENTTHVLQRIQKFLGIPCKDLNNQEWEWSNDYDGIHSRTVDIEEDDQEISLMKDLGAFVVHVVKTIWHPFQLIVQYIRSGSGKGSSSSSVGSNSKSNSGKLLADITAKGDLQLFDKAFREHNIELGQFLQKVTKAEASASMEKVENMDMETSTESGEPESMLLPNWLHQTLDTRQ